MNYLEPLKELLREIGARQQGFEYEEGRILDDLNQTATTFSNLGVKLLSIIGGILGTGFFMGFLGSLIWQSSTSCLVLGSVLIVASLFTNRLSDSLLSHTTILCAYISGLILISFGIHEQGDNTLAIVLMLISAIALTVASGFVMPFVNTVVFNGSLFALISINNAFWAAHLYYAYTLLVFIILTHREATFLSAGVRLNKLYSPIRSAFLFILVWILLVFSRDFFVGGIPYKWLSSLSSLAAIVLIITYILNSLNIRKSALRIYLYLLSVIVLLPAIFAPAILGALLILLLSYHYGHRTGFWTGFLALIYFVSRYYYDLNLTLLQKSELMMASGILFLLSFMALKKHLQHEN